MKKFLHKEAFCIMYYQDEETGEIELLWNSRDGVTPFCIPSDDGKKTMRHIFFELDKFKPEYKPLNGQRIFVDMTMEKARELSEKEVEKNWDKEEGPMRDHKFFKELGKEGSIEHLAKVNYGDGKQPFIDTYVSLKQSGEQGV